jgi:NTP pyrophosphatase (non-canonical NTP hydrolase)
MDIKDLIRLQQEFDDAHFPKLSGLPGSDETRVQLFSFLAISILGELGEFANIIKKIQRGDTTLESSLTQLRAEAVDVFIYLMKVCRQLDMDLEQAYLEKLRINAERFKEMRD